jgi:hypothetical protein
MGHYTQVTQAVSRMSRKPGRRHRPLRDKLPALGTGENPGKMNNCHNSRTDPFTFTTASVYLPATNLASIAEGGLASTNFNGLLFYQITNGTTLFQVGSGVYRFTVSGP